MGRPPGGNCFLRRIGRDEPDRAVMLYDDKTKERSTNTFYYRGGLKRQQLTENCYKDRKEKIYAAMRSAGLQFTRTKAPHSI